MSCKRVSQLFSLPEWLTDRIRPLMLLLPAGNSQCLGGGRYTRRLRSSLIFDLCCCHCCRIHTTCGSTGLIFENNGRFIEDKRSSGLPVTLGFVGSSLTFLVPFARWRKKRHEAFVEDLFIFFIIWRLFWILSSCNMSSLEHSVRHRNIDIYWNKQIAIKCPARSTKKEAFLTLEISKITFSLRNISPDELKHSFMVMTTLQFWTSAVWAFFSERTLDRNKAKLS